MMKKMKDDDDDEYRHKLHLFQCKSARGSGTSHRNSQILIERDRLWATKSGATSPGIDFEKS